MSLLSSYAPSAKFPKVGTKVAGRVTTDAQEIQQRDFDSGELLFWDDGKPRMQLVVTVDAGITDPTIPGDDGERSIYIKGQMLQATREACRKARVKEITEGCYFEVTYVEDEPLPKGKRGFPKKIYEVAIKAAPSSAGGGSLLASDRDDDESKGDEVAARRKEAVQRLGRQESVVGRTKKVQDEEPPF